MCLSFAKPQNLAGKKHLFFKKTIIIEVKSYLYRSLLL